MRLLRRVRVRAKAAAFDALSAAGLGGPFLRPRPGGRILVWHGLDHRGGSGFNARFVSAARFEEQVADMKDRFHVVPLRDYFEGERHPSKLTVVLTFDDGYESAATLALPILERHGVPASFFVTAIRACGEEILWPDLLDASAHLTDSPLAVAGERFVKDRRREWVSKRDGTPLKTRARRADGDYLAGLVAALRNVADVTSREELAVYWRTLSEEQVRRLAESPLVTLGSHGRRHVSLGHASREEAREEMAASKEWLQRVSGRPVDALAFPDGSFREETLDDAEALGYRMLLASDELPGGGRPSLRGRLTLNPFASLANQVRVIYSGTHG
ncbi:MAG: polysaccharide deacetylase family protein [Thermoanaerobaculia bacterium]